MRTAQAGNFDGAVLSELVMVVKGSKTLFQISPNELPDLIEVLQMLAGNTEQEEHQRTKRGVLWRRVTGFLENCDRAQGFTSILRAVGGDASGRKEVEHPLRVLLGRRVGSGDLEITPAGRYRLKR